MNTPPDGVSIRDWFAGQALAGLIANPNNKRTETFETIASHAFVFADAMLAERKKRKPDPDGWISHDGGPMPCAADMRVDVKFRNGSERFLCEAGVWNWRHDDDAGDIIAWRPAKKEDRNDV